MWELLPPTRFRGPFLQKPQKRRQILLILLMKWCERNIGVYSQRRKCALQFLFWVTHGSRRKWEPYFFRYNNKLDIINLLSWLHINTIPKDDDCLITFRVVRLDTTLPLKFVFMNKESKNREFVYIYKCLFWDLHERFPFDDFTMGVFHVLSVVPS